MIEADVKELCDGLRGELLAIEKKVRDIKGQPFMNSENAYPGQARGGHRPVDAFQVAHGLDARMRLGKVLQYARDGVSILDKP